MHTILEFRWLNIMFFSAFNENNLEKPKRETLTLL